MTTTKLKITGMHCASCKALIEDVCREIPGVSACEVNLESGVATVMHDDSVDVGVVKKEIGGLGEYTIEEII
ncbi:MAG: heavy metal-associated domain-containing protein [Patescibacteria group bacterium]